MSCRKNLIENGIKYTTCCQPIIEVNYSEDIQNHHFSVTDNGIGMEEKYIDQISCQVDCIIDQNSKEQV